MPILLANMTVEELVVRVQKDKRERKIEPVHASFLEIQNELKNELNRLVRDKRLTFGRLINDIYFKHEGKIIKEQENYEAGSGI